MHGYVAATKATLAKGRDGSKVVHGVGVDATFNGLQTVLLLPRDFGRLVQSSLWYVSTEVGLQILTMLISVDIADAIEHRCDHLDGVW